MRRPVQGLGFALLALAVPAARAAPDAGAPDGETVRLEPVFVEAASAHPWQYFRTAGFEVISHCPDDFNLLYARALDRATAARLAVLPADFWAELAAPMKIVLYNTDSGEGQGLRRREAHRPELALPGRRHPAGALLGREELPGRGRGRGHVHQLRQLPGPPLRHP